MIVLGALLETEWVLRSRHKLDKASIAGAYTALLESTDVAFEHPPTVEEAHYVWALHPEADFIDCLLTAVMLDALQKVSRESTRGRSCTHCLQDPWGGPHRVIATLLR